MGHHRLRADLRATLQLFPYDSDGAPAYRLFHRCKIDEIRRVDVPILKVVFPTLREKFLFHFRSNRGRLPHARGPGKYLKTFAPYGGGALRRIHKSACDEYMGAEEHGERITNQELGITSVPIHLFIIPYSSFNNFRFEPLHRLPCHDLVLEIIMERMRADALLGFGIAARLL